MVLLSEGVGVGSQKDKRWKFCDQLYPLSLSSGTEIEKKKSLPNAIADLSISLLFVYLLIYT